MSDGCWVASASTGKIYNVTENGIFSEHSGFGTFINDISAIDANSCFVPDAKNWAVKSVNKGIVAVEFVAADQPIYLSKIDENSFWVSASSWIKKVVSGTTQTTLSALVEQLSTIPGVNGFWGTQSEANAHLKRVVNGSVTADVTPYGRFRHPAAYSSSLCWVSDINYGYIHRVIDTAIATTIQGFSPSCIAKPIDANSAWVADTGNGLIKKITNNSTVTTISNAIAYPNGISPVDANICWVKDTINNCVKRLANGVVTITVTIPNPTAISAYSGSPSSGSFHQCMTGGM